MDIIDNCQQLDGENITTSEFAQDLQLVLKETRQFCDFDETAAVVDTSSFWQNFLDLIDSGFNNLSLNYELLLTGEIGAIFVVALIPLLLGIFLETTLLISHNRKELRQEQRQQAKLMRTHGSMLAKDIAQESNKVGAGYRAFSLSLFSIQLGLIVLFLIAVPEYDRDVWCDEHKTQYAILQAGLETEGLQRSQRRANCEIRQAVVAINNSVEELGSIFSQENSSTLTSIKKINASLGSSIHKLDEARDSIYGFEQELKRANKNTQNVIQTMNIMQDVAWQLGLNGSLDKDGKTLQNNGPVKDKRPQQNLPLMLKDIETQLQARPDQKQWQLWMDQQAEKILQLEVIMQKQALAIDSLKQHQESLLAGPMVKAISDKVIQGLIQQPTYPLILRPSQSNNKP